MISYDLPPLSLWGVAKHVNRLVYLLKEQYNVTLVSRSKNSENEYVDITSNEISDCLIESKLLPYESYVDYEYLQSWNYLLAKKVISETKFVPHIVHNHNWMTFPSARKIADHFQAKLVSTVHFLQKQYSITYNTLPIDSQDIIELENNIFKNSDSIILFGNNHSLFVLDNYNCSPEKIQIIPHGISIFKNFVPKSFKDKDKEKTIILFVGRLVKEKGINVLINVVDKLHKRYPNIELHIAGKGPLCNFSNYSFIKYYGFLNEHELNILYDNSDIFCFLSYTETFGFTRIEAAMHGLPIITSRGNNIEQLFLPGEALFIDVETKKYRSIINKSQIYDNIEKLIINNSLYTNYSEKSKVVGLRYNENDMVKKLIKHYRQILNPR